MEVCEDHLVAADEGILGLDGFLYLYDHLGDGVDILDFREDFGSGLDIKFVRKSRAFSGRVLDIYLMAVAYELAHA